MAKAPPRLPVVPSDLRVGALIEVLDCAGLWFPARVKSVSHRGIKVNFVAWSREWDAQVPPADYATHICVFRGWGESVPGDYCVGQDVAAMDLTNEWFKARVVAVAEGHVKVHYLGWTARWDEWIPRESGRLSAPDDPESIATLVEMPSAGGYKAVTAKAARAAKLREAARGTLVEGEGNIDLNDETCAVCLDVGELVCCEGGCLRSFHEECLRPLLEEAGAAPLAEAPEREPATAAEAAASQCTLARARIRGKTRGCGAIVGAGTGVDWASGRNYSAAVQSSRGAKGEGIGDCAVAAATAAEDEAWVCPDCERGEHRCAWCGELYSQGGSAHDERPGKCSWGACGRFFHAACLRTWWQRVGPSSAAAADALRAGACPAHVCITCGGAEDSGYGRGMAVCMRCGCAQHRSCIFPQGEAFQLTTLAAGLCRRCVGETAGGTATSTLTPCNGEAPSGKISGSPDQIGGTSSSRAAQKPSDDAQPRDLAAAASARGLANFRFAPVTPSHPPPTKTAVGPHKGCERGATRDTGLVAELERRNCALRDAARASSEIGFPWEPINFGRRPPPFALPSAIVEELRAGKCDSSAGFRPSAYTHITRSVWLASSAREVESDENEVCACLHVGLLCGEGGCFNRSVRHECNKHTCSVGEAQCANRRIQRQQMPAMTVFKTLDKGWGVRTDEPIFDGDFVIEYVGEVIGLEEWEQRNRGMSRFENMYFMYLSRALVIDARRRGNLSRFINHSCSPNVQVQKWFVNGQPRIAMFALRDIAAGEELSYNYNVQWTGDWEAGQRCKCGAATCTGRLAAASLRDASAGAAAKRRQRSRRPGVPKRARGGIVKSHAGKLCQAVNETDAHLAALLSQECKVCGRTGDDEETLLCDRCDGAFHTFCLHPRVEEIPEGDWYCPKCAMLAPLEPGGGARVEHEPEEAEIDADGDYVGWAQPHASAGRAFGTGVCFGPGTDADVLHGDDEVVEETVEVACVVVSDSDAEG